MFLEGGIHLGEGRCRISFGAGWRLTHSVRRGRAGAGHPVAIGVRQIIQFLDIVVEDGVMQADLPDGGEPVRRPGRG